MSAPHEIAFKVLGTPAPQGSKTRTRWGGMREDNPNTRPWRDSVAWEAKAAMGERPPLLGPVRVEVDFCFNRPKGHYGTGRNAGTLKPAAPAHHTIKPDLDKLLRAIGDAITGIVVRDDGQIAQVDAWKMYDATPSCSVKVVPLSVWARGELERCVQEATG